MSELPASFAAVGRARPRLRAGAVVIAMSMAATVVTVLTLPGEPLTPQAARVDKVIPHQEIHAAPEPLPVTRPSELSKHAEFPASGKATIALHSAGSQMTTADDRDRRAASPVRAGALPVSVAPIDATPDAQLTVEVQDRAAAARAGVHGVLLSVTPSAGAVRSAQVDVHYADFREAGGADYGSRLRMVELPACALTTPDVPSCQVQRPLRSTNDPHSHKVTADIALPEPKSTTSATAPMMVLATEPGGSGSQGTFEATSLSPSGTWSVGGSSGSFSWSYPVALPPVAASGTTPSVSLAYNSSRVDGLTNVTNNQSSWIGQGWEYSPGYIERTYRPCTDVTTLPAAQRTADLCIAGNIVTINLNGSSSALVLDDATQTWHPSDDSGERVEKLSGAANGAADGEYWKVTTSDGKQYFFGRNTGPGHSGQESTNSAWTVPIHGADGGAQKAWRWNLDFVRDPNGHTSVYYYDKEINHYGANGTTTGVSYVRGGVLKRIDYGIREVSGSIYGATTPAQVLFETAERCIPSGAITCDPAQFTSANASHWPDTPFDQQCLAGATCNNHSPTFWSTKRLTAITTQYNAGSGPVRVDRYQLNQSFPNAVRVLMLDSVVRTGYDASGGATATPPVIFTNQTQDNRVVGYHNAGAMPMWRMSNIRTETGSDIKIDYSQAECTATNVPADPAAVDKRCFPVYRYLPYNETPILDYFHKYVVTSVKLQDTTGESPEQVTEYAYLGAPAFHFDDNEVVKPHHRTYGQFRGYGQVEVRSGAAPDRRTLTRTTYLRGMHGDTMPGGQQRSASVTNSLGESIEDNSRFAGMAFETQTFDGDGGAQLSTSITNPRVVTTTATRARPDLPALTASVTATAKTRDITSLATGGVRTASTTYQVDPLGRVIGSTGSADGLPDLCTTTAYAENLNSWIRTRPSQTMTSRQACPAPGTAQTNVLSASKIYYDDAAHGQVPGAGRPTKTETATANTAGTLTWERTSSVGYDVVGRPSSTTDALGKVSTVAYTPADGGLVTQIRGTNAKNQNSTVYLEPSRGLTTASVDVSGRRTDAEYDQLGRLTAVWMPGRAKAPTTEPNVRYEYLLRNDGPLAVTTKQLVEYMVDSTILTNYVTSIKLLDSLGQLRQTQTDDVYDPNSVAGRVVNEVFYDSHGWAVRSNNRYTTTGVPGTTLVSVPDASVDDRTATTFDGSGRPTMVSALRGLATVTETQTVYGGDRTTIIPPQGGVTTTSVTDARGKGTALLHYTSAPTVTGNVVSGGTAQTTGYFYDTQGQLERMTDAVGNEWRYEYDFLGRKKATVDPDAGRSTTTYDLGGRITSTTDARGQVLSFDYDDLGRKLAEYSGSNPATRTKLASWTYDTAAAGVGKLATTTRFTPSGNYLTAVGSYHPTGLPADHFVRVPLSETGLNADYKTQFGYTTTGQITRVTPPTKGGLTGETITTEYDRHGNARKTESATWDYVSGTTLNSVGEPVFFSLSGGDYAGKLSYERDPHTHRLTKSTLSATTAWAQIDSLDYSYDSVGNLKKIVNVQGHPGNNPPTRTQCFDYDALARLSKAWTATDGCAAAASTSTVGGPTPYWRSWEIDAVGLRTRETQHALPGSTGGDTVTTYAYPAPGASAVRPHALSSTSTSGPSGSSGAGYSYDAAGNTTARNLSDGNQTLTWNENGRLSKVTTPSGDTTYVYDADGAQLIRREPGKTTLYLPGQEFSRNTSTGTITGTRYYSHGGQTVAMRVGGGNVQYLQSDHHGTAQVAMTAVGFGVTRREFDPYGNPLGSVQNGPWPDNHGFLGKPTNQSTGLTDIGARKYDPAVGRFISVDPVMVTADPQSWTGYAYANNNPTTISDPTGLIADYDNEDQENYYRATHTTQEQRKSGRKQRIRYAVADTVENEGKRGAVKEGSPAADRFYDYAEGSGRYQVPNRVAGEMLLQGHPIDLVDEFYSEYCEYLICHVGSGADSAAAMLCNCLIEDPLSRSTNPSLVLEAALGGAVGRRLQGANRPLLRNCSFDGDTPVLMADGTTKPIQEIKPGDYVMAADPETGRQGPREVTATWPHTDILYQLVLADGSVIDTTEDHPFWNATDKEWQRADSLDAGDALLTADGRTVGVRGFRSDVPHNAPAFNLTVDNLHTYYVLAGSTSVLVHNQNVGACPVNGLPHGKLGEAATLSRLEKSGYTNITSEVRFITADDVQFRADFVAKSPGGAWIAVESKTGRGATLTPGQTAGYPQLNSVGAIVDTSKLDAYGIAKGDFVTMRVEVDIWRCPTCGS